jgi:amino acid transporter
MARIRLLPPALASVHPRHRSPYVAVTAQFVFAVAVALWLGFQYGPLKAFSLIATIDTTIIIAIYMTVNLACLGYYLRARRGEFNWLLHGALPVLGIAAFVPAFFTALGVGKSVLPFVSPLPWPLSLTGPVVAVWLVAGLAYLAWLLRRHPDRVRATGRVFADEQPPDTEPAAGRRVEPTVE